MSESVATASDPGGVGSIAEVSGGDEGGLLEGVLLSGAENS